MFSYLVTDMPSRKGVPGLPQPPVLDPSWHPRDRQSIFIDLTE